MISGGNRSWLICLNLLNIRSEIWQQALMIREANHQLVELLKAISLLLLILKYLRHVVYCTKQSHLPETYTSLHHKQDI